MMIPVSFKQSLRINLNLLWEVSWKLLTPLFLVIFVVDYFFDIDMLSLSGLNEGYLILGLSLVMCFFCRKIFNNSLKRKYTNFQLNFIENQPELKFFITNYFINGILWIILYVLINYFIFDCRPFHPMFSTIEYDRMNLLQLEEQCIHEIYRLFAYLLITPIYFLTSVLILQWQLNRNSEKFSVESVLSSV